MVEQTSSFSLNFFDKKPLKVKFSQLDLSADGGLLLVRQAEEQLKVCQGLAACLTDNRELGKVKHPLSQLVSQRVYQILSGYEDSNDSNSLRHDPIFKIACDKIPLPGEGLLASQPTMSRLENQVTKKEIKKIRSFFLEQFLASYEESPETIVLALDAWDALTHGEQQLSLFHGYYGHQIY
ncbi:MAG: hypothetical protein RLZZ143_1656 [Cyanobacteriota bacterium]